MLELGEDFGFLWMKGTIPHEFVVVVFGLGDINKLVDSGWRDVASTGLKTEVLEDECRDPGVFEISGGDRVDSSNEHAFYSFCGQRAGGGGRTRLSWGFWGRSGKRAERVGRQDRGGAGVGAGVVGDWHFVGKKVESWGCNRVGVL